MSTNTKFRGVGVALITPFNADGSIDFNGFDKVLTNALPHVDYLVVNGTTSEASTLSQEEKNEILAFVIEKNTKKLPIMYGVGANDTQHVLELINSTDFTHIDAILTVSPYYNKPSQQGIIAHYTIISDASPVPVLLYNVPGRTGSNMSSETTLTLAKHPNIFGIKEASGDIEQCMKIAKEKPENFMIISGDDMLTTTLISIGGEGTISVLANAYPEKYSRAIHTSLEGDFIKANKDILDFIDLNPLLYAESNPVGVKETMTQLGLIKNYVRLPLLPASETLTQQIKAALL